MRTTLDIDDDVLLAAKDLASRERLSAGEILGRLARQGLQRAASLAEPEARYGFAPKAANGPTVTNAQIDTLRAALGED